MILSSARWFMQITHCVSLPSSPAEFSVSRVESLGQTPTCHSVLTFVVLPEAVRPDFSAVAMRSVRKPDVRNERAVLVAHSHTSQLQEFPWHSPVFVTPPWP